MTSLRRRRSSFDDEPAQYKEKTAGVGTALQFSLLLSPGSTYRTTHTHTQRRSLLCKRGAPI